MKAKEILTVVLVLVLGIVTFTVLISWGFKVSAAFAFTMIIIGISGFIWELLKSEEEVSPLGLANDCFKFVNYCNQGYIGTSGNRLKISSVDGKDILVDVTTPGGYPVNSYSFPGSLAYNNANFADLVIYIQRVIEVELDKDER